MLVNLDAVLKRAKEGHYAVGLFNTSDTDMLEAAISAAEEAKSPIIIGTAEVLLPYGPLPLIAPAFVVENTDCTRWRQPKAMRTMRSVAPGPYNCRKVGGGWQLSAINFRGAIDGRGALCYHT